MQPSWQRSLLLPPLLLPPLPALALPVPAVLPSPLSSSPPQATKQQPSTSEKTHGNEALMRLPILRQTAARAKLFAWTELGRCWRGAAR